MAKIYSLWMVRPYQWINILDPCALFRVVGFGEKPFISQRPDHELMVYKLRFIMERGILCSDTKFAKRNKWHNDLRNSHSTRSEINDTSFSV